jgi:putative FmdB family regulatory protein
MPIYEYVCGSCKKKTEVIQGMNDPRLKVCPHCAGKLTKAFSAPAIQFKGSGFYITDYPKGTGEGAGRKSDGESAGSSEKSEKSERSEKAEKAEKADKAEKSESAGKSEKVEKKAEKKKEKKG